MTDEKNNRNLADELCAAVAEEIAWQERLVQVRAGRDAARAKKVALLDEIQIALGMVGRRVSGAEPRLSVSTSGAPAASPTYVLPEASGRAGQVQHEGAWVDPPTAFEIADAVDCPACDATKNFWCYAGSFGKRMDNFVHDERRECGFRRAIANRRNSGQPVHDSQRMGRQ